MPKRLVPAPLAMLKALIAQPSISSTDPRFDQSNLAVIELLAGWLETLGFQVRTQPLPERKANLVATLGDTHAGEGLVLSGHTDTVPCDPSRWKQDPFQATERDGRLYGLGSADMKSFFGLAIEAAHCYRARDLKRPLVILATADEESSMSGAKALAREGLRPGRFAVIGEPTGLRPVRMHKGVMMESIRVNGQAGHSSDPGLGANAIEGMQRVLGEILEWRRQLQARYHNPLFKVAVPTLNIGSIHGGDNPNRICGQCEAQIDIRPLPGMDIHELQQELQQRLKPLLDDQPRLSLSVTPLFEGLPPFEAAADSCLVHACETLSGHAAEAVAFGTEAPYLSQLGMETVVMGPGSIDQAHQANEFLSLDQIDPAVTLLRRLIETFCIADRPGQTPPH